MLFRQEARPVQRAGPSERLPHIMNMITRLGWKGVLPLALAALAPAGAHAGPFSYLSDSEQITAISSKVYNGYERTKGGDGSYPRELFVFGNGGQVESSAPAVDVAGYLARYSVIGGTVRDPSIDDLSFHLIAQMIEVPLSEQNYRPTQDPKQTKLLIMVYWGRAQGTNHIQDGPAHDAIVANNARLMGFDQEGWMQAHADWSSMIYGRSFRMQLLDNLNAPNLSALEMDRYYVVLRAFDFQSAWKQKKLRLLWETRFSLSERGHLFNEELPVMAQAASHYFGQATGGLIRTPLKDTQVEIGELKNLGDPNPADEGPK